MSLRTFSIRIRLFVLMSLMVASVRPSLADETWQVSMDKAGEAFEKGDFDGARMLLQKACSPAGEVQAEPSREALCRQGEAGISAARGEVRDAIRLSEQARDAWLRFRTSEESMSRSSRQFATLVFNLGVLYKEIGRYREAETQFREAHPLLVKALGETSPEAAVGLVQLGATLTILGSFDDAEATLDRAFALQKRIRVPDTEIAATLCVLAQLRMAQGNRQAALSILKDAEKLHRPHTRDADLRYADILLCLASVYRAEGDNSRAQPLLRKALHAYETSGQGSSARHVGILRELALLDIAQGKHSLAEGKLSKALELARSVYGSDAIDTALIENDLARLYALTPRRYQESEQLFQHALEVVGNTYGPNHRDTAIIHGNLAFLYERWKRAPQAENHYEQAVSALRQTLGAQHVDTSTLVRQYDRFRSKR